MARKKTKKPGNGAPKKKTRGRSRRPNLPQTGAVRGRGQRFSDAFKEAPPGAVGGLPVAPEDIWNGVRPFPVGSPQERPNPTRRRRRGQPRRR